MSDPLSIAGLAAGLVSLGLQVSGGIIQYLNALDCREQDISSTRQQNESLQKLLPVIEASLSQLRSDHLAATTAAQTCLDSCRTRFKALQDLIVDLTRLDKVNNGKGGKIARHGKRLLYPFKRPKLRQLEDGLRNTNAALQLALQALGLAVSAKHSTTLETTLGTHATSHAADILRVHSEVLAIGAPLGGIHSALSKVETRLDTLGSGLDARLQTLETLVGATTDLLANSQIITRGQQKVPREVVTGRLLAKPAACREIFDAVNLRTGRSSPASASMRTGEPSWDNTAPLPLTVESLNCTCPARQRFRRNDRVWGSIIFSTETAAEQHVYGCPLGEMPWTNRTRKIGVTYTGLKRLLNTAVQLSFAMRSGAGGWSISPGFVYYPTVDASTAPAFKMVNLLAGAGLELVALSPSSWRGSQPLFDWKKLVALVSTRITRLFQTGKASPLAVNFQNMSLNHCLAQVVDITLCLSEWWEIDWSYDEGVKPLLDALKCLVLCEVPATDYDLNGRSPLGAMMTLLISHGRSQSLHRAASEYILFTNSESAPAYLSGYRFPNIDDWMGLNSWYCLSSQPVAQAFGCGPLSLAVIANDAVQVRTILQRHSAALKERNLLGHSPLHLAADKPSCLRLLAEAANSEVLEATDVYGTTALEMAILLGLSRCRGIYKSGKCRRYPCAECPLVLLRVDCAVPAWSFRSFQNAVSSRCKRRFIRALKDRRERLKQLALRHLTAAESEQLGLLGDAVLDLHAPQAVQLLQQRQIHVPDALQLGVGPTTDAKHTSMYREVNDPRDAELLFQLGFRDTEGWLDAYCAATWRLDLPYIQWLDKHGVDAVSTRLRPVESGHNLFTAHSTCFTIGRQPLRWKLLKEWLHLPAGDGARRRWIQELHLALLRPELTDDCQCKCSTEGCTPLKFLLEGVCQGFGKNSKTKLVRAITGWFLPAFLSQLDTRHHLALLRFLTFHALGIAHTCHRPVAKYQGPTRAPDSDAEEFEDDHASEHELLEKLLEGFQGQFLETVQNPHHQVDDLLEFWEKTWYPRVSEVRQHLEDDKLPDAEKRRAEEIGVVWDQPSPPPPPEDEHVKGMGFLARWVHELDKIEAECQ